jgi:hypothetical protein
MTHLSIDTLDENVKQFVLGLATGHDGTILELNGQPIACVVAPQLPANANNDAIAWTEAKNARRIALIKQKHAEGITAVQQLELAHLQDEMLRYRQKVAPLPLEYARRLHQDLLSQPTK